MIVVYVFIYLKGRVVCATGDKSVSRLHRTDQVKGFIFFFSVRPKMFGLGRRWNAAASDEVVYFFATENSCFVCLGSLLICLEIFGNTFGPRKWKIMSFQVWRPTGKWIVPHRLIPLSYFLQVCGIIHLHSQYNTVMTQTENWILWAASWSTYSFSGFLSRNTTKCSKTLLGRVSGDMNDFTIPLLAESSIHDKVNHFYLPQDDVAQRLVSQIERDFERIERGRQSPSTEGRKKMHKIGSH